MSIGQAVAQSQVPVSDVQTMLNWSRHLTVPGSGVWDGETREALRRFQAANREPATGELTQATYDKLHSQAERERQRVGFTIMTDRMTGVEIGIPTRLVGSQQSASNGGNWHNGTLQIDTLAIPFGKDTPDSLHYKLTNKPNRIVTLNRFQGNEFLIEGREGGDAFRVYANTAQGGIRGYSLYYRSSSWGELMPVLNAISSSFRADPRSLQPMVAITSPATLPAPPVTYTSPPIPAPPIPAPPAAPPVAYAPSPSAPPATPSPVATPALPEPAPPPPPPTRPSRPATYVEISQQFQKIVWANVGDLYHVGNADIDEQGAIVITVNAAVPRAEPMSTGESGRDIKGDANHLFTVIDTNDPLLVHLLFHDAENNGQLVLYSTSHKTAQEAQAWSVQMQRQIDLLAQMTGRTTDPLRAVKQAARR